MNKYHILVQFCFLLSSNASLVTRVSVVKKVAQYMADVLEDSRDKVQENLLANGGNGCLLIRLVSGRTPVGCSQT